MKWLRKCWVTLRCVTEIQTTRSKSQSELKFHTPISTFPQPKQRRIPLQDHPWVELWMWSNIRHRETWSVISVLFDGTCPLLCLPREARSTGRPLLGEAEDAKSSRSSRLQRYTFSEHSKFFPKDTEFFHHWKHKYRRLELLVPPN